MRRKRGTQKRHKKSIDRRCIEVGSLSFLKLSYTFRRIIKNLKLKFFLKERRARARAFDRSVSLLETTPEIGSDFVNLAMKCAATKQYPRFRKKTSFSANDRGLDFLGSVDRSVASNFDSTRVVSTPGYLIVNCGSAHARARSETTAPLVSFSPPFLSRVLVFLARLGSARRTTHARYFVPSMCQEVADYGVTNNRRR